MIDGVKLRRRTDAPWRDLPARSEAHRAPAEMLGFASRSCLPTGTSIEGCSGIEALHPNPRLGYRGRRPERNLWPDLSSGGNSQRAYSTARISLSTVTFTSPG